MNITELNITHFDDCFVIAREGLNKMFLLRKGEDTTSSELLNLKTLLQRAPQLLNRCNINSYVSVMTYYAFGSLYIPFLSLSAIEEYRMQYGAEIPYDLSGMAPPRVEEGSIIAFARISIMEPRRIIIPYPYDESRRDIFVSDILPWSTKVSLPKMAPLGTLNQIDGGPSHKKRRGKSDCMLL
jgi:hypothetical protein